MIKLNTLEEGFDEVKDYIVQNLLLVSAQIKVSIKLLESTTLEYIAKKIKNKF